MDKQTIITQLKARRIELNYSQQQTADKAGTYKTHISAIEAGKKTITIDTLISLCNALELTISIV